MSISKIDEKRLYPPDDAQIEAEIVHRSVEDKGRTLIEANLKLIQDNLERKESVLQSIIEMGQLDRDKFLRDGISPDKVILIAKIALAAKRDSKLLTEMQNKPQHPRWYDLLSQDISDIKQQVPRLYEYMMAMFAAELELKQMIGVEQFDILMRRLRDIYKDDVIDVMRQDEEYHLRKVNTNLLSLVILQGNFPDAYAPAAWGKIFEYFHAMEMRASVAQDYVEQMQNKK